MEHDGTAVTGPLHRLGIRQIPPDNRNSPAKQFRIVAPGETSNGEPRRQQLRYDGPAQEAPAAGDQHRLNICSL